MYLKLIDAVSKIVKSYGIDILSDSKFWHILTDSYSFASEYSLKDTFTSCLNSGYISKLLALRGNTNQTKSEIAHIIDSEKRLNSGKEQEYSAVLFSVAIAIGTFSKKDYSDFINRNHPTSSSNPTPNNNTPNNKDRINTNIVISTAFGLLILWGSTLLYGTYLNYRWWISGIALLMAIFQLAFCGFALNIFNDARFKRNKELERTAVWCYLPIIVGYFINDLVPLFLCSSSIRYKLSKYFITDFHPVNAYTQYNWMNDIWGAERKIEAPGIGGISLIIILLFSVFSCGLGLYSEKYSFTQPRFQFRKKPVIVIVAIITIGYWWIIVSPYRQRYSQERDYMENQQMLKADKNSLLNKNSHLVDERCKIIKSLSFKGIGLGISLDTAIGHASSLENEDNEDFSNDSSTIVGEIVNADEIGNSSISNFYFTIKETEPLPISILTGNTYDNSKPHTEDTYIQYKTECYESSTSLDNNKVFYRIIAANNRVFAITVNANIYGGTWSDDYYAKLVNLYTAKYGEPEIEKLFPKAGTYYIPDEKAISYQWTFADGVVYLSEKGIVYLYSSFIKKATANLSSQIRLREEQQKAYDDSVKRENARQLRLENERKRSDSIKRMKNHENAINEI